MRVFGGAEKLTGLRLSKAATAQQMRRFSDNDNPCPALVRVLVIVTHFSLTR